MFHAPHPRQAIPGGKKLADMDKGFFGQLLSSQMTNDVYEDVKPKKIKPVTMDDGCSAGPPAGRLRPPSTRCLSSRRAPRAHHPSRRLIALPSPPCRAGAATRCPVVRSLCCSHPSCAV